MFQYHVEGSMAEKFGGNDNIFKQCFKVSQLRYLSIYVSKEDIYQKKL